MKVWRHNIYYLLIFKDLKPLETAKIIHLTELKLLGIQTLGVIELPGVIIVFICSSKGGNVIIQGKQLFEVKQCFRKKFF